GKSGAHEKLPCGSRSFAEEVDRSYRLFATGVCFGIGRWSLAGEGIPASTIDDCGVFGFRVPVLSTGTKHAETDRRRIWQGCAAGVQESAVGGPSKLFTGGAGCLLRC